MNKHNKKRNVYNKEIVEALILKYGFKKNYIEKSIRGDRTGFNAEKIKKDYISLLNTSNKAINKKLTEI